MVKWLGLLVCVLLAGCGGGSSSSTVPSSVNLLTPAPARTAASTPAPNLPSLSSGAAAYLDLSLSQLANYARPALPAHYDAQAIAQDNTPAGNATTDAGATLGRVLFNDPRLSVNGAISCASCHRQSAAFSDTAQFSTGFSGSAFTSAHAMRLANVRYYSAGTMFWDKRAASVEAQAIVPLQNSVEMGWDAAHGGLGALIASMQTSPYYPELFAFVYGDGAITLSRVQNAIAQYERSIISTTSRWDAGYALVYNPQAPGKNLDADIPTFSAQENRGRHLFMAGPGQGGVGCASCHAPPTFALVPNSGSNGLDFGATTVFKSPSLKNAAINGPYMHDGRFATLAQVVEHYNSGVLDGPALDPRLRRGGVPQRLNLPAADEAALVAFMQTLSDSALLTDQRFATPFKK